MSSLTSKEYYFNIPKFDTSFKGNEYNIGEIQIKNKTLCFFKESYIKFLIGEQIHKQKNKIIYIGTHKSLTQYKILFDIQDYTYISIEDEFMYQVYLNNSYDNIFLEIKQTSSLILSLYLDYFTELSERGYFFVFDEMVFPGGNVEDITTFNDFKNSYYHFISKNNNSFIFTHDLQDYLSFVSYDNSYLKLFESLYFPVLNNDIKEEVHITSNNPIVQQLRESLKAFQDINNDINNFETNFPLILDNDLYLGNEVIVLNNIKN